MLLFRPRKLRASLLIPVLVLLAVHDASAQEIVLDPAKDYGHLVSSDDLRQQVFSSSAERRQDIETLDRFISSSAAEEVMNSARMDPVQVKSAIPALSDAELASLAARVDHAHRDFAAAGLLNLDLVFVIILVLLLLFAASGAW